MDTFLTRLMTNVSGGPVNPWTAADPNRHGQSGEQHWPSSSTVVGLPAVRGIDEGPSLRRDPGRLPSPPVCVIGIEHADARVQVSGLDQMRNAWAGRARAAGPWVVLHWVANWASLSEPFVIFRLPGYLIRLRRVNRGLSPARGHMREGTNAGVETIQRTQPETLPWRFGSG